MVKRSTVIITLGFLVGLSLAILAIAIFQSRQLQNEITVIRRQEELNQLIENKGATLSFGPTQAVPVNEEFSIPVVLTSEQFHVVGADIEISYDPQLIEIVSIDDGGVFDHFIADEVLAVEQKVVFSVAMEPEKTGFTGSEAIASITVRALQPGTANFEYIYNKNERNDTNVSVSDLPGEDVLETVEKLQVTIQ